jgi:hypothetical protein
MGCDSRRMYCSHERRGSEGPELGMKGVIYIESGETL